jgi:Chaperone of endosialidase
MNPVIQLKKPTPLIVTVLSLACFALAQAVVPPPDGGYPGGNTAEGNFALLNTTGLFNTAVGLFSLAANTLGNSNTGVGASALRNNTDGGGNTAVGADALNRNRDGVDNTAVGIQALFANIFGHFNTALGSDSLHSNRTGDANTAVGVAALANNNANQNTAVGGRALVSNTSGFINTAVGYATLFKNTTGLGNTAIGMKALENDTTGGGNIAVGVRAGSSIVTGNSNIHIGNSGLPGDSETMRIGQFQTATYIAGISGQTASGGAAVFVNTDGKLGTLTSSARFKTDIKSMDKTSEAILSLKPVTFRYKKEVDTQRIPQFGLVAEDVEKVNPDLVVRDGEGKVYSVRYEAINAMLLNEFLKEHRTVQELKSNAAKQEATIARQQKQIEALTAGLQKVSAQLEASKPALRVVNNNQ